MPGPHDELLTATEYEAAQLLVTLAWRLDGGQLVSADQLLARLCAIPANDVTISAWVGEASRDQAAPPAIPQLPGQV
jgi:hypothetical protein